MTAIIQDFPLVVLILELFYLIGILLLSAKIIVDTKTSSKTLAYLLLIVFLPFVGVVIYFFFGVNYRKNLFFKFKIHHNQDVLEKINHFVEKTHFAVFTENKEKLDKYFSTNKFLFQTSQSPLTSGNYIKVLKNGEEKFPLVLEALKNAKHHIHLEYYIYKNDNIGNAIADVLMQKAQQGVKVRFLYDAFGSGKMQKKWIKKLKDSNVEILPVNKLKFRILANRANYRDHRKIIIIDGNEVFTGGVNVCDKYINNNEDKMYWRDTHLHVKGPGLYYFQYIFLSNWIFASEKIPALGRDYFNFENKNFGDKILQVAASGPDTKPVIMMSTVSAIYAAKTRIYITTPYFIPVESVLIAIKQMALSGVEVKLIVPAIGDSKIVNAAAYSYYEELLEVGVKIYLYQKGFVHAKTILVDDDLAIIGSANMDVRSQELNFEVNTVIYDKEVNQTLYDHFLQDIEDSSEIILQQWTSRPKLKIFFEHLARLFSPLL